MSGLGFPTIEEETALLDKRIQNYKKKFRILAQTEIKAEIHPYYTGQVNVNPDATKATIYGWHNSTEPEPKDYVLHEIFHVALKRFHHLGNTDPVSFKEVEEEFVQDLTAFHMSK